MSKIYVNLEYLYVHVVLMNKNQGHIYNNSLQSPGSENYARESVTIIVILFT